MDTWIRATLLPLACLCGLLLAGCGGGGSAAGTPPPTGDALETELRAELSRLGHTGVPSPLQPVRPADDPLVKLGQVLFFSRSLSGGFDVACASCHHPKFAGSDGLSLPVGIAAENPVLLGPGRRVQPGRDADPARDCSANPGFCGPNIPRNSQTTFNVALYTQSMLFDGRVEWADQAAGLIRTIEVGITADVRAGHSLVGGQALLPIANANEMRGYGYIELTEQQEYRAMVVRRLKGQDAASGTAVSAADADRWLALFRAAFAAPAAGADELITLANIQRALDAFQTATTFTDTPWARYVAGTGVLSDNARLGALLFFRTPAEGGLGCAGCHAGNLLSDEQFHNVGFPQIGRGKRPDGRDFGRHDFTRSEADNHAFRTPSLINIALTAPYGHAGTFASLDDLLRYHANPSVAKAQSAVARLPQFAGIDVAVQYPQLVPYTQEVLASANFNAAGRLPMRELAATEVIQLGAFLRTLTDLCAAAPDCVDDWVPARSGGVLATGDDPDGHLLVVNEPSEADVAASSGTPLPSTPTGYPTAPVPLSFPATPALATFAEIGSCAATANAAVSNAGTRTFASEAAAAGIDFVHGLSFATWMRSEGSWVDDALFAGGMTWAYVNNDCWPDLVATSGEPDGVLAYLGNGDGTFAPARPLSSGFAGALSNGVAFADLNGDYRREAFIGHFGGGTDAFVILAQDATGDYPVLRRIPMYRSTWGMSFGDINGDGFIEMLLGHWDGASLASVAPAMWKNDGGSAIRPWDLEARTGTAAGINQSWQFTPSFADFDGDGHLDIAVAADFATSRVLQNNGGGIFTDVTDRPVISDENAMGAAVGDYDNDGRLDWFVTSILDPGGVAEGLWGVTGNRLYRNVSTTGAVAFADVTTEAGVAEGYWGWGACLADFNNDGWLDIFHENGFGYMPDLADPAGPGPIDATYDVLRDSLLVSASEFLSTPARLFISNGRDAGGNVSFSEQAAQWDIGGNTNGRGVACSDFDRDGDIDIAVLRHSAAPALYVNQVGATAGRAFLGVRLVGRAPNTDAIGATVSVTADTNGSGVINAGETMLRMSAANSNFGGQNLPDLHFGLGHAASATVDIRWPDGTTQQCTGVSANRFIVIDQRNPVCP